MVLMKKGLLARHAVIGLCLLGMAVGAVSCSGGGQRHVTDEVADTVALRYARGITLVEHADYLEALIADPWKAGSLLARYEMRQPLTHAAVFISSVASLADDLGCLDAVSGICEPEYMANAHIHHALSEGRMADLGSAMTPDKERIIDLAPDALLLSPFENVSSYGNLDQLGIPIIPCADYMESSPLARAEWMRFYGRLFGCGETADSLFAAVEASYLALQQAGHGALSASEGGEEAHEAPRVIFDTRNGSAWYMPGGRSTLGQMVADAGGRYVFADDGHSGSVPYSFEQVYDQGREADVWLLRYTAQQRMTLPALRAEYEPYSRFRAFREGRVYGCNNAELIFFEEYPFHPDRLLLDLVRIFSGRDDEGLRYFHRL